MSSMLGSIADNDYGTWETYRMSKAALNMGARSFFHRHPGARRCSRSRPAGCAPTWAGRRRRSTSRPVAAMSRTRRRQHAGQAGHRYVNYDGSELPW